MGWGGGLLTAVNLQSEHIHPSGVCCWVGWGGVAAYLQLPTYNQSIYILPVCAVGWGGVAAYLQLSTYNQSIYILRVCRGAAAPQLVGGARGGLH